MHDHRKTDLTPRERALCDFAVKLTHLAAEVDQADIDLLQAQGIDDAAISDAIQVVSYFNYVTRVADGVGIEDEREWTRTRREDFSVPYASSAGISLWRNFWAKLRFGSFEVMGGYQKFKRTEGMGGALFVYPITVNLVVRGPEALVRPYVTAGGGMYGWDSRIHVTPDVRTLTVGWDPGWTAGAGIEYYLRPRVALDVGLRYHSTGGPGASVGLGDGHLRFFALWVGHYVRF